jgi:signal transduction histidine kinase
MLAIVVDQTDRLARLVDRLLDVSRLELNKLVLERAESDLAGLVRGVAASIQALAPNHRVEVRSPERTLAFVDALRVEQVVSNLLVNAIKFSPASDRVEVEVFCPAEEVVGVAVRDWGPGIPAEHRPHVFGRLYQAHAATRQSGMGLGLYVSRQIAELHGGALEAEFPSDGGTRFVLTIPTAGGVDPTAPGTIRERCLALSSR